MNVPMIGITLDHEAPGNYSKFPWYALRENYILAISNAGGLPWPLPHSPEQVNLYLTYLHGLLITGGAFDIDPALFGDKKKHASIVTKKIRTDFEVALVRGALERDMPILGICGGQQLLHVIFGGKLIQHIPDDVNDCLAHEQVNPRNEAGHCVHIVEDTLLHDIVNENSIMVNSAHHQAAADKPEPKNLVINARASDGIIEGVEALNQTFCIGVQWHPEFWITNADKRLFSAFIKASQQFAVQRK